MPSTNPVFNIQSSVTHGRFIHHVKDSFLVNQYDCSTVDHSSLYTDLITILKEVMSKKANTITVAAGTAAAAEVKASTLYAAPVMPSKHCQ